ncbi:AMP-binding protein, partial [Baekduia sp.]|uniref:AMP-binding protein n=1 Tax=Baekduia sp. TaxID=2600305 RepID=UPI002DF78127|nr:AMP-binding protein [Baekduia sp.]
MATIGTGVASYEEARSQHRWDVPDRYNIARDVCDKHPRDKLAMVWEDWQGNERRVTWGEMQSLANRAANVLAAHGVQRGDRVAVVAPATAETAAVFLGAWKLGAILLSMSVLYGDEGIQHRVRDSQPRVLVTDAANADRMPGDLVDDVLILSPELLAGADDHFETLDTAADDPAQLYYSSGTTGLAKGILHAHRYVLAHEEFVYCHDIRDAELFHGMG